MLQACTPLYLPDSGASRVAHDDNHVGLDSHSSRSNRHTCVPCSVARVSRSAFGTSRTRYAPQLIGYTRRAYDCDGPRVGSANRQSYAQTVLWPVVVVVKGVPAIGTPCSWRVRSARHFKRLSTLNLNPPSSTRGVIFVCFLFYFIRYYRTIKRKKITEVKCSFFFIINQPKWSDVLMHP